MKTKLHTFLLFCAFGVGVSYFDVQSEILKALWMRFGNPTFPKVHTIGLFMLWIAGLYALWVGTVLHNKWRRWITGFVVVFASINAICMEITKAPVNEFYYGIALAEWRLGWGYVFHYAKQWWKALDDPTFLLLVIDFARFVYTRVLKIPRYQSASGKQKILAILIVILSIWQVFKYKATFNATPSAFSVPGTMLFHHTFGYYNGPREAVTVTPTTAGEVDHIILMVDESVRADLLEINGYTQTTNPFLRTYASKINFGLASSAGNCSRYSNTILRTGLRMEDLPDRGQKSLKTPSLFQYAQKAGYKTVYITNHMDKGQRFDNGMNEHDLPYIDHYILLDPQQKCRKFGDCGVAQAIVKMMKQNPRTFIYVNKNGAHFPYSGICPDDFQPITKDPAHSELMHNYLRSMVWCSDRFLAHLLPKIASYNHLLIYTSDHGEDVENVHDRNGHGSFLGASWKQATVPLIVFTNQEPIAASYQHVHKTHLNKLSHYVIAPTLLRHMGYDHQWIHKHFGQSVFDAHLPPQKFFTGNIYQVGYWHNLDVPACVLEQVQKGIEHARTP